jgi:hypothetical protein
MELKNSAEARVGENVGYITFGFYFPFSNPNNGALHLQCSFPGTPTRSPGITPST